MHFTTSIINTMNNSDNYRQFEDEPIEHGRMQVKITVEHRMEINQPSYSSGIGNDRSPWLEDNIPGAMDFSKPPPYLNKK